jgi:hypothetical protein
MLSPLQISRLIDPVMCRAQADFRTTGFEDRAACLVLQQLGRAVPSGEQQCKHHLVQRWNWLDKRAIGFFERYPEALGIEVGGGLSTRFHRICEKMEWPRFRWRSINTLDVVDCLKYVFPDLDNYLNVVCDSPMTCWTQHVRWNEPGVKLVILGENQPLQSTYKLNYLVQSIENNLCQETSEVHLLLSHKIPNFVEKVQSLSNGVSVLASMLQDGQANALSRVGCWLGLSFGCVPDVSAHHLVFRYEKLRE